MTLGSLVRRVFGIPAVMVVLFASLHTSGRDCVETPSPQPVSPAGVIPDSYGAIAEILLQYDPSVADELEPLYRDLFDALPRDVRIRVLCPTLADAEQFAESWRPAIDNRPVDVINVGLPMSIWARDRCIARQSADLRAVGATFVPVAAWHYEPEKENDLLLQDVLHEAHLAPQIMNSPLHFEGGNVVSNRHHVFYGVNVFSENAELTEPRVRFELTRLLGREPVCVHDPFDQVPWRHIDMFLTPISEDTVLVASPRLAYKLLELDVDGNDAEESHDSLLGDACPSDTLQDQFDDIATLLRHGGYKIHRLPAIVRESDQWMITYNNVLLDFRNGHRVVYMPVYGVEVLDQLAASIYCGLGFEVRTVDASGIYERGGALRCVANVTRRRDPDDLVSGTAAAPRMRVLDVAGVGAFDGMLTRCRDRLARRSHRCISRSAGTP